MHMRIVAVGLLGAMLLDACAGGTSPAASSPPPASSPSPSAVPSGDPSSALAVSDLLVYFTDETRYATAIPPYEVMVARPAVGVAGNEDRPLATIRAFFAGPTPEEAARGLIAVTSGFTGVSELRVVDAVAHVFLEGACASTGATYTVANAIAANLLPFPEIEWVKVYDEHRETEVPTGQGDSLPLCLEP